MREFSVPGPVTVANDAGLADMVFDNAATAPDTMSFRRRRGADWVDVTAAEFAAEVSALAKGLIAEGIGPGDRVAIMSKTRYEWTLADYAIWAAGAVSVPVYETSSADQVRWIVGDSGAVAAFVETAEHAGLADAIRADVPALGQVWTFEDGAVDKLTTAGQAVGDDAVRERRRAVRADDLATIIYTSGTTGRPKGCELTHRNLLFEVKAAVSALDELFHEGAATLLFLPVAHVLGRVIQCAIVYARIRLGHTSDVKNLQPDIAAFGPTFLLVIPRVLEKVYNGAKARAHADGHGRIFDMAERVAIRYSQALDARRVPLPLRAQHRLFDRLVYVKLRAALGGRCQGAISGGAPLGERLGHFFRGLGLFVYEGYGLTETTAACCVNRAGAVKVGTVGRPLPGVAIRIADDGEILVKGGVVFRRYRHDERGTAEAFSDGWFRTGDLGALDEDGFLRVTGRKKELIITSGGKNVSPAILEDRLRAHPLISQCMVVGDRQPFVGALITLDPESTPAWCQAHGLAADTPVRELRENADLRAEIQRAVDDTNATVSRAEGIRKFLILEADFTEAGGELTPSLKLKRTTILDRYGDEVASIYEG